jgi:hypothetical protein
MSKFKSYFNKNKVFILGLLSAIAVSLQQFVGTELSVDYKVVGFASLIAVVSYIANQWRGQGLSITGIIGNAATVFITQHSTGQFSWEQFILQTIILIISLSSPDPKSRGYENTRAIVDAKKKGEEITPAKLTAK